MRDTAQDDALSAFAARYQRAMPLAACVANDVRHHPRELLLGWLSRPLPRGTLEAAIAALPRVVVRRRALRPELLEHPRTYIRVLPAVVLLG